MSAINRQFQANMLDNEGETNVKKQPEITAKTKETLVTAFCHLYAQKPIDKITVKEITDLAGYNRCTFYKYFPDVYDLLEYIESNLLSVIKRSWNNENETLFSPDLGVLIKTFSDKEVYLKAILGDYGSIHFMERLKKELPYEDLAKSFPEYNYLVNYVIEFHLSTSLSLFRAWIKNQKDISSEELLKLIHDLYTKGISIFNGIEG